MPSILPSNTPKQAGVRGTARPTTCPLCGLTADNAVIVRGELTASATYVDTEGHIFSVNWVEVA